MSREMYVILLSKIILQSELNIAWPKLTIFFGKTTDEILVPKKA